LELWNYMSSRTRAIVLAITAPVVVFAIVGGLLGTVMAREDTYQHLKIFDDVVSLISSNYVEPVNIDKVMRGAMNGLVDSLDPDSAYLSPDEVKQAEGGAAAPAGDLGIELTRQYYLRVLAARDNSPAAKAGLRTGDYVRAINDVPTRDMSVWQGMRALRGAVGSKVTLTIFRGNAADPHVVSMTREALSPLDVTGRMAAPGVGYVRVPSIGPRTADQMKSQIAEVSKNGATKLVIDVRRTASGSYEQGIALARLFVAKGTLALRETKGAPAKDTIAANPGDGGVTLPAVVLMDNGTSGAAELFASALNGNQRADLVGEHTIGRTGIQKLVKLPGGSGLWLTTVRYLTPAGTPLHEKGLEPTVSVEGPEVEFGQPAPTTDAALEKAIEHVQLAPVAAAARVARVAPVWLAEKKAA
jgi:carboxyl-terminal processing protease